MVITLKKYYKKLSEYCNLDNFATFMGTMGQLAPYIQAFKIFSLESAEAVSFWSTFIACASMVTWLIFGIARNVKPLIISSIIGVGGIILVFIGLAKYG